MMIKLLSLWEPWAWAMIELHKRNETRSFYTEYRGWLGIHAAQLPLEKAIEKAFDGNPVVKEAFRRRLAEDQMPKALAYGALLGFVHVNILIKAQYVRANITEKEYMYGDYSDNRWVWKTSNVVKLPKPIEMGGKQGLWNYNVPDEISKLLLANEPQRATLFTTTQQST